MEIKVDRYYKGDNYTIGYLYADGKYLCHTLEDTDRGLTDDMDMEEIKRKKIQAQTAIPRGRYEITLDTYSPSFGKRKYYKEFCKGYLPRLLNVKGFSGILIHRGVHKDHTEGCILVGYNTVKGLLTNSQKAFEEVYNLMLSAKEKGEEIWIDIV